MRLKLNHGAAVRMRLARAARVAVLLALGAGLIAACDGWVPITIASKGARDCRDQFCEGDVRPPVAEGESAVKVNNRWYAGPALYFNGYESRTSFEWWDSRAVTPKTRRAVDLQAAATRGQLPELAVEISLHTPSHGPAAAWQDLDEQRVKGTAFHKRMVRPDLEEWLPKGDQNGRRWYVAISLKDSQGRSPTLRCDGPAESRTLCVTGLGWGSGGSAAVRLRGRHAADWPDIYLETARILGGLRPV